MPSLGSVTEGMLGTQLDLQNIQLNQAKIAEAPITLEKERIGLQMDRMNLAKQTRMLELMQGLRPGESTPDSLSGVLSNLSLIQAESGMPDEAAKTARAAYGLQDTASKVDYRTYKMQTDRFGKFANILSSTPDTPAGFTQAVHAMMADDPGVARDPKFQQILQQGWKPGLVPALQRGALTAKEQAEVTYRQAAAKHADAATTLDTQRVGLIKAQTKLANDRDAAVSRVGGTPVKANQLQAITDQAIRDYPSADPADVRVRARPLAEDMLKTMKEQGLTLSEAATRVYEAARAKGTFSGLREMPLRKGTKPGAPLPLPKTAEQMQQNQWYMVDGVSKLLVGTKLYTEDELDDIDKEDENEDEGTNPDDAAPAIESSRRR